MSDSDRDRDGDVLRPKPGREDDPTLMRNQAAMRRSEGTAWLIIGALFLVAGLLVFGLTLQLQPLVSAVALVALVALYAAMLVVRFTVTHHRPRMLALATLLIAMAVVSLVCAVLVNAQEWAVLR